jgi:hypothetical protein
MVLFFIETNQVNNIIWLDYHASSFIKQYTQMTKRHDGLIIAPRILRGQPQ